MAGTNSASLKRSKPNYIYSIIGVAIVLFIMGIMGWLFLNLRTIGDHFKEDIRISVYLKSTDKNTIGKLQAYIAGQPYAKNVEYVNKEKAKAIWNAENSEDWAKILDVNPLPESVDFFAKAEYVNPDSLSNLTAKIGAEFKNDIADIQYPKSLVSSLNERADQFPQIQTLQGMGNNLVLFFGLIVVGVGISVLSTYRSVVKYLKMKLDELY